MIEKLPKQVSEIPAVDVVGVCRSFDGKTVLEKINLRLTGGSAICICGANAAGKTTIVRIIAGLMQPDAGTVKICGFNVKTDASRVKPIIGAILHKSMVYPQLTVEENLRFFADVYNVGDGKTRTQEILNETGLSAHRFKTTGVLSRGIMQRLAIARALIHRPAVLLADEPFTGLDGDAVKYLIETLHNFKNQGGSIVMTTHNIDFALRCCEQVAVLDNKKIIFNAEVSKINVGEFAADYLSYARKNR